MIVQQMRVVVSTEIHLHVTFSFSDLRAAAIHENSQSLQWYFTAKTSGGHFANCDLTLCIFLP